MVKYDGAITVFSPDGHLFQVEYAQEAVKKGTTALGVRGKNCIVLGVEKKSIGKLQDERLNQKLALIDNHVAVAFAGLQADSRSLLMNIRRDCKGYRLSYEDPPSVEQVAKMVANAKQNNTQSTGRRPYGISWIMGGFNMDGIPRLFQTDPSGTHFEWLATAIGRSQKSIQEYLENKYSEEAVETEDGALNLTVKALTEIVQSGAKSMDIGIMRFKKSEDARQGHTSWTILPHEEVEKLVTRAEKEKEEENEKKKPKKDVF